MTDDQAKLNPEYEKIIDRIWAKYSLDGETMTEEAAVLAYKEIHELLAAAGLKRAS